MTRLASALLLLCACASLGGERCTEVDVALATEVDVWVGHWRFTGPIGVRVCAEDVEIFDEENRKRLRGVYEEIIAELTLLSLRLCWTEPPDERWTASMVKEFKEPYLERLNELLPRGVLRDMSCSLGFVEYEPELPAHGAS